MARSKGVSGKTAVRRAKPSGAKGSTLVEKITDELRDRITDRTFAPGEHLKQAALARKMGVSPIPFREAIRVIESEGFIEIVPFKGARVKHLTFGEISERAEIAYALECHAIELALPTLSRKELDLAARMAEGLYPAPDIKTWFGRVNALLRILCGGEQRPQLYDLILRNRTAGRRYTELLVRKAMADKVWERDWAAGHFRELIKAMRARDVQAIRRLERHRFDSYLRQLLPWLQEEQPLLAGGRRRPAPAGSDLKGGRTSRLVGAKRTKGKKSAKKA